MKKALRILALSLVFVLATTAFTGCTSNQDTKPTTIPSTSASASPSPATNGTITMGTNAAFPPFEFVTENGMVDGQFSGIDVEIAMAIAKAANKELKIADMAFDSLLGSIGTGKIDFAAAGMTANDERREQVDFSDTYYVATQGIIVAENSDIKSANDLKDKRVGVVLGYTGEKICQETLKVANLTSMKRGVDCVQDLKNGKLDAVVIDLQPAKQFVSKNPGIKVIEDPSFEAEEYAIAVKKGNTEVLDIVNKALAELKATGKLDEIIAKYDGQ